MAAKGTPWADPAASPQKRRRTRKDNRRPCLGDFQKVWDRACAAIGLAGRIPYDLRRSGVKHYIDAGKRYHIIDLEDLRSAGRRASEYRGPDSNVRPLIRRTAPEPPQQHGKSRALAGAAVEVEEC